jgi:hypothetical protein
VGTVVEVDCTLVVVRGGELIGGTVNVVDAV